MTAILIPNNRRNLNSRRTKSMSGKFTFLSTNILKSLSRVRIVLSDTSIAMAVDEARAQHAIVGKLTWGVQHHQGTPHLSPCRGRGMPPYLISKAGRLTCMCLFDDLSRAVLIAWSRIHLSVSILVCLMTS